MKKIVPIVLLTVALPLCAMNDPAQSGQERDQSARGRYDGIPNDGGANAQNVRRPQPHQQLPAAKPKKPHPVKATDTKRRKPRHGEQPGKKSPQSLNKELISKTRLLRVLVPTVCAVGAAALVASEYKAHRAGKTTNLRRLWRRVRRIVRGETREEVHQATCDDSDKHA